MVRKKVTQQEVRQILLPQKNTSTKNKKGSKLHLRTLGFNI